MNDYRCRSYLSKRRSRSVLGKNRLPRFELANCYLEYTQLSQRLMSEQQSMIRAARVYASDDWARFGCDEAQRYGTVEYRQAVGAAQQVRCVLAAREEQLTLAVLPRGGRANVRCRCTSAPGLIIIPLLVRSRPVRGGSMHGSHRKPRRLVAY